MYIDKGLLDLLSDEAARQLRELPRQDAAGTFRRLVKKALGRQTPKKDDLFWPAGLLLLGLWEGTLGSRTPGNRGSVCPRVDGKECAGILC